MQTLYNNFRKTFWSSKDKVSCELMGKVIVREVELGREEIEKGVCVKQKERVREG